MKKNNYKIGILILIIGLIGLTITIAVNNINYKESNNTPDSGFDVDYGGGGGSDFGGSSGSSDSGGSGNEVPFSELPLGIQILMIGFTIFFIGIVILYLYAMGVSTKETLDLRDRRKDNMTHPIFNTLYSKYGLDYNGLLNEAYRIFVSVQTAWMNFDYQTLRENLTDELFNEYAIQLDALKLKNQQNVMFGFNFIKSFLDEVKEENNEITFLITLRVSFHDFIIEHPSEKVIRGSRNAAYICEYTLTYKISQNNDPNYCPNCNAPLDNKASGRCPYCNSIVISKNHKLILVKKEIVSQI